jgi:cytochrome o ubiquinol oxidase operon protein cyoD
MTDAPLSDHLAPGDPVGDRAPGDERPGGAAILPGLRGYLIGLVLAAGLTAASFYLARSGLIYGPAIPAALTALAVGQMGVHLVFFLHVTTGPDNVNNALALAFGVFIVALIIGGSVWIMYEMNQHMAPHMAAMHAMQ